MEGIHQLRFPLSRSRFVSSLTTLEKIVQQRTWVQFLPFPLSCSHCSDLQFQGGNLPLKALGTTYTYTQTHSPLIKNNLNLFFFEIKLTCHSHISIQNKFKRKIVLSSLLRIEHFLPAQGADSLCGECAWYIIKSLSAWRCSMINVSGRHFDSCPNRIWLALKHSCCSGTSRVIKGCSWLIAQFLESLIIAAQSGKFIIKHIIYSSTFGWSKLRQLDFFWLSIWSH